MPEDQSMRGNPFRILWQFVRRHATGDVPEDLAICEFDCRKGRCMQDEWETCDRRIRKGAGELCPDPGGRKPPDRPL